MATVTPYEPQTLPLDNLDYRALIALVGEANATLAHYSGLLQGMVNPAVLLSPITNQEAVLSSKIEGTQATLEEVLEHEAGQTHDENKTQDIREVLNYRKALMLAQEQLQGRPLRLSLLLHLHTILMDSVRGQNKTPGEFRKEQNWIGRTGCTMEEASFIPPSPLRLHDHLQAWESYLSSTDFDVLAQTAIAHAQFELIHPFKDGNGRIGRLLIPLLLYAKGRLFSPMFYLSAYMESNRDEYYARLKAISKDGDWTGWIAFFLRAITEQATDNTVRVQHIMSLYDTMKDRVRAVTHSQHTAQLVDLLFAKPIFRSSDIIEKSEIPKPTAHLLIRQLEADGILKVMRQASGRRPAIYVFPKLLELVEGKIQPTTQQESEPVQGKLL